jgi:hypothetical protein
MRVAWDDALAVLAALASPRDGTLRDGVMFLGPGRPDQLGLGLDAGVVHDALLALADVGYVDWESWEYSLPAGASLGGLRVTGAGMQALGQWPALHTITTPASLAHLLEALADYAADAEKEGTLRQAAAHARRWGASALRQSVVSFGAAALRAHLGLGP